ncbi:MAG: hypothetical protein M3R20_01980 [Pseudomonadota bacterium]|nr:hypothetical protein [Pseudomonadota bacterium]
MKRTHSMMTLTAAVVLAIAAPFAFAQSTSSTQDTGMQHPTSGAMTHTPMTTPPATNDSSSTQSGGMSSQSNMSSSSMGSGSMMGQHDMSGTVTSVNSKGITMVKTDDGILKVHFPDASQNLKKGDKITLHLSYSKDSSSSSM